MDFHKLLEDSKAWITAGLVSAIGGLWLKLKQLRADGNLTLINELQEELRLKEKSSIEANALVVRLHRTTNYQRFEIFLHTEFKKEAVTELKAALEHIHTDTECSLYIMRAIAKLEQNVMVPDEVRSE